MGMDITSANAVLVMTVEDIFPAGFPVEQFATDASFSSDELVLAEYRMGIDGKIAGGFVPSPEVIRFSLEASSPTIPYIDQVIKAMKTNRRIYKVGAVITIPAISKVYTYETGIFFAAKTLPDGKKVLDPQSFGVAFESGISQTL